MFQYIGHQAKESFFLRKMQYATVYCLKNFSGMDERRSQLEPSQKMQKQT